MSKNWAREKKEIGTIPEAEASEVSEVLESYGLTKEESQPIVAALRQKPEAWVNFMMRFELGLEEPRRGRALRSALTIAGACAIGGSSALPLHVADSDAFSFSVVG